MRTTKIHAELPDGWDLLAEADDLYVSVPWFASQASGFAELDGSVVMVSDQDGTPLAGLPMFPVHDDDLVTPFIHPAKLLAMSFGEQSPDTTRLMPSLLCGGRQSTATRALTSGHPTQDRGPLLAELISAAVRHADDRSLSSVAFLYVDQHDQLFRDALAGAGFTEVFSGENFLLDIEWPDFAGYMGSRGGHRRRRIKQDLHRYVDGGVRLDIAVLGDVPLDRLADLTVQRMAKYGKKIDHAATMTDFKRMHENFGDQALVFLAWIGEQIAGFSLFLQWRQHLYAWITGFDYDLQGTLPLYFAVAYYEPIAYAAKCSFSTIHYGPTAGEAKMLRGCRKVRQYGYYLGVSNDVNKWLRTQVSG